jgi:hypothetical protein
VLPGVGSVNTEQETLSSNQHGAGGQQKDDLPTIFQKLPNSEEIIFNGNISRVEVIFMVLNLFLRHNLKMKCAIDIFYLLNVLAGKKILHSPKYFLNTAFRWFEKGTTSHFYCRNCKKSLGSFEGICSRKIIMCPTCGTAGSEGESFLIFDVEREIRKKIQREYEAGNLHKRSTISDICSGQYYKDCSFGGLHDLSFNLNVDGANIFKSSKRSLWPIQIILNEVNALTRFKSPILCGVWLGKGEPLMQLFLGKFFETSKRLWESGIKWSCGDEYITSKLRPFCICVDSVARPLVMNATQFNGYYGCGYCHHRGVVVGRTVKYPQDVQPYTKRDNASILQDVEAVKNGQIKSRGIKGPSIIQQLPGFNFVYGLPPDYMHSVLLGVTKQIMELWLSSPHKRFYIGSPRERNCIEKRLVAIRPPSEVHRLPRPIRERKDWKASEWRNWLLFYSLPCIIDVLPFVYVEHFSLLVHSIFILLKNEVTASDIDDSQRNLNRFVWEWQIFYGEQAMNFNVHLLLHLPDSVKMTGPLWCTSTFPFESGIYNIKKTIGGPNRVIKQIANTIYARYFIDMLSGKNSVVDTFVNSIFDNKKNLYAEKSGDIVVLGKGIRNGQEISYKRVILRGTVYCSSRYRKSRNNDSYVRTKSGDFGRIIDITSTSVGYNFLLKELWVIPMFGITEGHLYKCIETTKLYSCPGDDISEKCVFICMDDGNYLSIIPNKIEIQ